MLKCGEAIDNRAHGHDCVSNPVSKNATKSRLRSLPDRVRQVALYEVGGVCLISPLLAIVTGAFTKPYCRPARGAGACHGGMEWRLQHRIRLGRTSDYEPGGRLPSATSPRRPRCDAGGAAAWWRRHP